MSLTRQDRRERIRQPPSPSSSSLFRYHRYQYPRLMGRREHHHRPRHPSSASIIACHYLYRTPGSSGGVQDISDTITIVIWHYPHTIIGISASQGLRGMRPRIALRHRHRHRRVISNTIGSVPLTRQVERERIIHRPSPSSSVSALLPYHRYRIHQGRAGMRRQHQRRHRRRHRYPHCCRHHRCRYQ